MDVNDPVRRSYGERIRRAYITGLVAVGLLSTGSYFVLDRLISEQGAYATVINVAGRQRMLSQRIAGLAQALVLADGREPAAKTPGTTSHVAELKRDLAAAVALMDRSHRGLRDGAAEPALPGVQSDADRAFYVSEPHRLDARVGRFLDEARRLLASDLRGVRREAAGRLEAMARHDLLASLNAAVHHYEDVAVATSARAQWAHLALLGFTLAVLLAEAVFIFAPLARELSDRERQVRSTRRELEHRSSHDELTGLRNRQFLRGTVEAAEPRDRMVVVFDLDNFKNVNDTYGHATGDTVLRRAAAALVACARGGDEVVRLGGDEFLLVMERLPDEAALGVCERIATRVTDELRAMEFAGGVTVSAGVAPWFAGHDLEQALADADIALYEAKTSGRDRAVVFGERMRDAARERSAMERTINDALRDDRFVPHFQPQLDMRTGAVVGVEALARMVDGDGAVVPPSRFLPVAAANGTLRRIGHRIIEGAIRQAARWEAEGTTFERISVNASATQLLEPGLCERITELLGRHGLAPSRLSIEVLESVLLEDGDDRIIEVVATLRRLGVTIELDDFGMGHTSIANVTRLDADRIKIDRSFIAAASTDERVRQVLRAMIAMAEALEVRIVAEGVETAVQQSLLLSLGCTHGQGFRFARPMGADEIGRWFRAERDPHEGGATFAVA